MHKMEETGIVESISGNTLKIALNKKPLCEKCGLCRNSENAKMYLEIENTLNAKSGDEVIVETPFSNVGISAILYGVPSIFLILGILSGVYLFHSEIYGFIFGLIFLVMSFVAIKLCNIYFKGFFLPKIKLKARKK